jgi:hypothetical protein
MKSLNLSMFSRISLYVSLVRTIGKTERRPVHVGGEY